MNTLSNKIAVAVAAGTFLSLMGAGNASAYSFTNTRPINVSGTSLQGVLDDIDSGLTVEGVGQDQSEVALWDVESDFTAGSAATIIIELAGLAGSNEFGIYDPLNKSLTRIFEGGDKAKEGATIEFSDPENDGTYVITVKEKTGGAGGTDEALSFGSLSSSLFGFYLGRPTTGTFFYTDDLENGGTAHALVFEGNGNDLTLGTTELADNSFDPGSDWILAWEDIVGGGDQDFNDMVLKIDGVGAAIPEPLTMLGAGAAASFGAFFKRQTSKRQKKDN